MNHNTLKGNSLTASLPLDNEKEVTPVWNISDSLSSLFSFYYKQILYSDITSLLNKGFSPENIIIFDSEFHPQKVQIDLKSRLFEEIKIDSENIVMLYELGLPYGMFPSKKIQEIHLLFSFFDSINDQMDFQHILKSGKLKKSFRKYEDSDDLLNGFKYLYDTAISLLSNIRDSKEKEQLVNKMNLKYDEFKKKLSKLQTLLVRTVQINKSLLNNNISTEELKKQGVYYSLYNRMFSILFTRWIPLIAVYNESNNSIRFLSTDVFIEIKNPYFFDLKEVSHNSPTFIEIAGLAQNILGLAFSVFTYYYPREINIKRSRFSDLIDLSDLPVEFKEDISNILHEIEKYNDLSVIIKLSISSHFIKDELKRLFTETLHLCGKTLADSGFYISTKKKIVIYK